MTVGEGQTAYGAESGRGRLDLGLHRERRVRRNTAAALVDFDNWYRATPAAQVEPVLAHCLNEVTRELVQLGPRVEFILIRLYGGWTENGTLTPLASEVAAAASVGNPFPLALQREGRIIHGEVALAHNLSIAPHVDLGDSSRRRSGPPRLRLNGTPLPAGCIEDMESCPAKILQRFTKAPTKSCPSSSCPVTAETAFVTREQKMVDTLMACDLLDLAHDDDVVAAAVVSADVDLLPPLIHARSLNRCEMMLMTNLPYWSADQIGLVRHHAIAYCGPEAPT